MKIGLISDLHLERYTALKTQRSREVKKNPTMFDCILDVPAPSSKLDVLILAGDICEVRHVELLKGILSKVCTYASTVIYIDGNHESWGKRYQVMPIYIKEAIKDLPNVHYLNNESINVNGIEFFGSCLWTDFGFNSWVMEEVSDKYSTTIRDRNMQKIKWQSQSHVRNSRAGDIQYLSGKSKREIIKWLELTKEPYRGKRVLVTHYPPFVDKTPLYSSTEGKEASEALRLIDCTEIPELSNHKDVIVAHGHLHNVTPYRSNTGHQVYCNPRGTYDEGRTENYSILEFDI